MLSSVSVIPAQPHRPGLLLPAKVRGLVTRFDRINSWVLAVAMKLSNRWMLSKGVDLTFVTHREILSLSKKVPLNCNIFSAEKQKFVHHLWSRDVSGTSLFGLKYSEKKINSCVESWLKTCFMI